MCHLSLWNLQGEAEVRDSHVATVVEQDVLWLAVAVHDAVGVQVIQAQQHLSSVELGPATNIGRLRLLHLGPRDSGLRGGFFSLSDERNSMAHCWDVLKVSTVFMSGLWVSPLLLFSAQIRA